LTFTIRQDDLASQQTRDLLMLHLAGMHDSSPPDNVFALDLSGLQVPDVTVWSAWSCDPGAHYRDSPIALGWAAQP
jgi:putative acetyltransferase